MGSFVSRLVLVFLASTALFLCGFSTPAVAGEDDLPDQVVIGYQAFPTAEIVMKNLGWYEQALGRPVKWVPVSSGMQAHQALTAGALDMALLGTSPTAAGIANGIPLQVIWIHDIIGDNEALVVKKDSGINIVKDLVGKTVAAPFGSTTDYHLMVALMLNRVDSRKVTMIHLEPRDMLAAWKKGEIDAGFIWMPTLASMIEDGGKVILTSRSLAEKGFPTGDLGVVRTEFGEKYPRAVVLYLKMLDRAVKYIKAKPDAAAKAIAQELGMPLEDAEKQMKGLIPLTAMEQNEGKYFGGAHWNFGLYTVLKETADFLADQGVVKDLPPREAFMKAVNATFLIRAIEE